MPKPRLRTPTAAHSGSSTPASGGRWQISHLTELFLSRKIGPRVCINSTYLLFFFVFTIYWVGTLEWAFFFKPCESIGYCWPLKASYMHISTCSCALPVPILIQHVVWTSSRRKTDMGDAKQGHIGLCIIHKISIVNEKKWKENKMQKQHLLIKLKRQYHKDTTMVPKHKAKYTVY